MEEMIELDIRIGSGDLYDYNLRHTYNSASGILGSAFGALMILVGLGRGIWIFVIGGAVLLLYLPWTLFLRSKQQIQKNPVFQKPLHYVLDGRGITISQGETETTQSWEDMVKAVSTGRSIIVYTSRVNATIFPRRQMGDKTTDVIACISAHMPPSRVKIKL